MPGPRRIRIEGHLKGTPDAEVNFIVETVAGPYPTGPRIKLRRPSIKPITRRPIPAVFVSPSIIETPPNPIIIPKELQEIEPRVPTDTVNEALIENIIPSFVEEDKDESRTGVR